MTKQTATSPVWFHPIFLKCMRWSLPCFLIFAGSDFIEGDLLWAGIFAFLGLWGLIFRTKAVNQTPWITVGVRLSVAAAFFYTGMYIEMGDLPFGIGFGVGGYLVYAWLFRPDWSTSALGIADTETAKDNPSTEESDTPD
ncbi:MAG: hypothetical protein MK291_11785 [Planctomycetes bacterium]|nr:hypothetical protein [Planctomycetota bacterium]